MKISFLSLNKSNAKLIAVILTVFLAGGIIGQDLANANINSNNSSILSQYSCEQGVNFVIAEDNAITPNYYSISGQSTPSVPCGTLVYGGATNNGGATGTNATQVIQSTINALPNIKLTGYGIIYFEAGNYTIKTLTIPAVDHMNIVFDGTGSYNTHLYYIGSNTKPVIWEPYVFTKISSYISHLYVEIDNLDIKVGSSLYTGNAVDLTAVPEITMNHNIIEAPGATGNAGSIGFKHDIPKGDGNAKEIYDVTIQGFGTDMQWNDDHAVFTGDYFTNYVAVGVRMGNVSSAGSNDVTMINPHFQNNNSHLLANQGVMLQFNYTVANQGVQFTMINPFYEVQIIPQCEIDLRGMGGSQIDVISGLDGTGTASSAYPRVCLPVAGDLSRFQFHGFSAPALFGFPYLRTCNYFGVTGSRIRCTGSSASATPLSGTVYQDWIAPTYIIISGGTGVNITITSNANNAIVKNLATIGVGQPFILEVGYKLIVTYATPPVTTCFVIAT